MPTKREQKIIDTIFKNTSTEELVNFLKENISNHNELAQSFIMEFSDGLNPRNRDRYFKVIDKIIKNIYREPYCLEYEDELFDEYYDGLVGILDTAH